MSSAYAPRRSTRRAEELIGTFDFERNVFGSDKSDDRTIIGKLDDGTTVKGRAREGTLESGLPYRFLGYWTEHPRYGRQFAFQSFTLSTPSGQRGTIAYLKRGPGIGTKRAQAIWREFGPDSLTTLREHPEIVAEKIHGLTAEKAREAAEYFSRLASTEAISIELTELLGGRGFPRSLPEQLLGDLGEDAPNAIRKNPYLLMAYRGVGFLRTDALYLELGLPPDAIERQAYCAWHALHSDSEGHTWHPFVVAQQAIERNIATGNPDAKAAIAHAIDANLIAMREFVNPSSRTRTTYIAEASRAESEQSLANHVHRMLAESQSAITSNRLQWPDAAALTALSEHQQQETSAALAGLLCILAGRPGTGKTYCMAEIIKALSGRRLAVCASTGKAAVRATESLAAAGIANVQATTIHRLLKVEAKDGQWKFQHDASNPLPLDFVLIDEASMIDTPLAASLLAACPPGCHVLLVGDPGQLSPVGHGAPLRDLIAAGLPCGQLTEIRRNSGRIVQTCKEIEETHTFETSPKFDPAAGENLIVIERTTADAQIEKLKSILHRVHSGGAHDVLWDCQIVVPVNDKSRLGRRPLNTLLQNILNPLGARAATGNNPFRVGDKIVCLQNGFLPEEADGGHSGPVMDENGQEKKVFVANGELAKVEKVEPLYTVARLWNPDRLVRIPKGVGSGRNGSRANGSQGSEAETDNASNDGGSDSPSASSGCSWDLGYALSVHKSQGSEWPVVIVILDSYPGAIRLCDRHWLYTAISRAKSYCICIGQKRIAQAMVRQSHMWKRKTFLVETIRELQAVGVERDWESVLTD